MATTVLEATQVPGVPQQALHAEGVGGVGGMEEGGARGHPLLFPPLFPRALFPLFPVLTTMCPALGVVEASGGGFRARFEVPGQGSRDGAHRTAGREVGCREELGER